MSPQSEYQKEKQAKRETMLAKQARQQLLSAESVVESQTTSERIVPKTFKEKWINFWYHYKFIVLGLTAVGIMLIGLFVSIFSKEKPDASITFVATKPMDGASIILQETVAPKIPDNNGDGDVVLNTQSIQLAGANTDTTLTAQQLEMNKAKFIALLSEGETFLYVLDEECYDAAIEFGVQFKSLDGYIESEKVVGDNHDRFSLKESKISEEIGLRGTLDNMYLCIVDFSKYEEKTQEKPKFKNAFAWEEALLKQFLAFESK